MESSGEKCNRKENNDLELLEKLTSKSKLTEEDVEKISKIINKEVARKVLDE